MERSLQTIRRLGAAGAAAGILYSVCLAMREWAVGQIDIANLCFVLTASGLLGLLIGTTAGPWMEKLGLTYLWHSVALAMMIGLLISIVVRSEYFWRLAIEGFAYPPFEPFHRANEYSFYIIGKETLTLSIAGPMFWFLAFGPSHSRARQRSSLPLKTLILDVLFVIPPLSRFLELAWLVLSLKFL